MITSINPATGETLESFTPQGAAEVDRALDSAVAAQRRWREAAVAERCKVLTATARVLRARAGELARLITLEMGKPIVEAEAEIEKCAWNCDFYAGRAEGFLAPETVETSAAASTIVHDPLGVVLAIMPWNFPFWQLFRFAAPALAAGNGAVLKHASNVPRCALAIEGVLREAGLPDGLFRSLLIEAGSVEALIADPRIAAVTLTGSTEVGSLVAAQAGKHLKKQVLELGGSDPFIVLADADVNAAATTAARSRNGNAGQSCIAAKRFIVEAGVADAFTEAFCAAVAALTLDDPMLRSTQIGPMARDNLRRTLQDQLQRTLAEGARLRLGGKPPDRPGWFFAPTIVDAVTPDMTAFREETFGPIAAIAKVADADAAVELANATEYGLGAALWTADIGRAERLARRIEAGAVFVNALVASDPRMPFGGVKRSGYGRELGRDGIREFTNIKSVWIGPNAAAGPALAE